MERVGAGPGSHAERASRGVSLRSAAYQHLSIVLTDSRFTACCLVLLTVALVLQMGHKMIHSVIKALNDAWDAQKNAQGEVDFDAKGQTIAADMRKVSIWCWTCMSY